MRGFCLRKSICILSLCFAFNQLCFGQDEEEAGPQDIAEEGQRDLDRYEESKDPQALAAARSKKELFLKTRARCRAWTKNGSDKCTLDNQLSQDVLRFLLRYYRAENSQDQKLRTVIEDSLEAIRGSQYRNGGFSQMIGIPKSIRQRQERQRTDLKASLPKGYPKDFASYRKPELEHPYNYNFTLNDGTHVDTLRLLIEASLQLGRNAYLENVRRGVDFLVRAQLPAPQSGWAAQYSFQMQPEWARAHEPPAVSSRETVDVISFLLEARQLFQDQNYCRPIPAALRWLRISLIPESSKDYVGPRYFELVSNRRMYLHSRDKKGNGYFVDEPGFLPPGMRNKKINRMSVELENLESDFRNNCGQQ